MSVPPALQPVLLHMRAEPSRIWSLIVTVFGDMILPRGGRVWLGTLLEIFAALGAGGNAVRTAMSRLAADGWVERNRVGRNSYYRLAEKGRVTAGAAAGRIYGGRPAAWDGAFAMAVLEGAGREVLEAAGYAVLSPGVMVGVAPGVVDAGVDAVFLRAAADPAGARRLAAQVWPTERLGEGYRRFLGAFRPLQGETDLGDLEALLGRLLLVHAYRRLVLRDPLLPAVLMPADWPGDEARALCGGLYRVLLPGSERWLDAHGLNEDGTLPAPGIALEERFAGF